MTTHTYADVCQMLDQARENAELYRIAADAMTALLNDHNTALTKLAKLQREVDDFNDLQRFNREAAEAKVYKPSSKPPYWPTTLRPSPTPSGSAGSGATHVPERRGSPRSRPDHRPARPARPSLGRGRAISKPVRQPYRTMRSQRLGLRSSQPVPGGEHPWMNSGTPLNPAVAQPAPQTAT